MVHQRAAEHVGQRFEIYSSCKQTSGLHALQGPELVEEGFATERAEILGMAADYRTLDAEPARRDLIWRYGIASEIVDPVRRTTEIGNWLRTICEPGDAWDRP